MHGSLAKEAFMRTIFLAAALAAMSLTSIPAHADGAWCARDTRGGTNCGFHTFAQCQADISGIGGSCSLNPSFLTRIMHDGEKLRDGCGKKRAIHVANRCPNKLHRVSALRHSRHDRRYAASLRPSICPAQETHN
jgi:hypothetical protein